MYKGLFLYDETFTSAGHLVAWSGQAVVHPLILPMITQTSEHEMFISEHLPMLLLTNKFGRGKKICRWRYHNWNIPPMPLFDLLRQNVFYTNFNEEKVLFQ